MADENNASEGEVLTIAVTFALADLLEELVECKAVDASRLAAALKRSQDFMQERYPKHERHMDALFGAFLEAIGKGARNG